MNSIRIGEDTVTPAKVVCIGRNYLEHIRELGNETPEEMLIFSKPNSAISSQLQAEFGEPLHYESEICFLLCAGALHGVGFGLDLTRRELQSRLKEKGLPWERAKGFDGAACLSDFVLLGDTDVTSLSLELEIDGELRQSGGYDLMMHKPDEIVAGIEEFMALQDNDIIMTGTPKGVGQIERGQRFTGRVKSGDTVLVEQTWIAE